MDSKPVRDVIATWYRIHRWNSIIEPIQVVSFTGSFVTYIEKDWGSNQERRESRSDIFPTFEEAKSEAIRRSEQAVENAKNDLHRKQTFLGNLQSLKEPSADGVEPPKPYWEREL